MKNINFTNLLSIWSMSNISDKSDFMIKLHNYKYAFKYMNRLELYIIIGWNKDSIINP